MIPEQLAGEAEELRGEGSSIDITEGEGWVNLVFHDYRLAAGYSKTSTELLLKFPLSYPNGKPDMFWVEPDITLANGQVPKSADGLESAVGRQWRRFSWHPQNWNPGRDNLRTYLEFINSRLSKGV